MDRPVTVDTRDNSIGIGRSDGKVQREPRTDVTVGVNDNDTEWWRTAVIYQIYPRSFADHDGDGIGDLKGVTSRLGSVASLGVDAVWLSPFFTSPQNDGGYDVADFCNVDPVFGSLEDFDDLVQRAHDVGLRVIIDIVPNHTSSEHEWFQQALSAHPGDRARDRYFLRPGRGVGGELPPNNWQSSFGGPAWSRIPDGEWFLHLFDSTQPDLDWRNPTVRADFRRILRFWLDRGVDGFRVDVAHGVVKAIDLPDYHPEQILNRAAEAQVEVPTTKEGPSPPYMLQDEVHEVWREWRAVVEEYGSDRILCAEAWVEPLTHLAKWVREDEMHQAFNFAYLETHWNADSVREVIDESLEAFNSVGAPSTWVLSNHDVVRHATRLGMAMTPTHGDGLGPSSEMPDAALGLARARAATLLMLALPGSAYLYQGEELGLPEVPTIPNYARQDPMWFRSGGAQYGRDGCRVPIPWSTDGDSFGFSPTGRAWLPQPPEWAALSWQSQVQDPHSTLSLYRSVLRLRTEYKLGAGKLIWVPRESTHVLSFINNDVIVASNFSDVDANLPEGVILASSFASPSDKLRPDECVWVLRTT